MLEQPTPAVTALDVLRILEREFSGETMTEAGRVLETCGEADCQQETPRVRMAILKLAGRDLARLWTCAETAYKDHRDVIGQAEYPGFMKEMMNLPRMDSDRIRQIVNEDWEQYQRWVEQES